MGFFDPQWVKFVGGAQLTSREIDELERLREECGLPHDAFALLVGGSAGMMKNFFELAIADFKRKYRKASPKQLLAAVYRERQIINKSRANLWTIFPQQGDSFQTRAIKDAIREEQIRNAMEHADQNEALVDVNDVDGLVACVLEEEKCYEVADIPLGIYRRIDKIMGYNR